MKYYIEKEYAYPFEELLTTDFGYTYASYNGEDKLSTILSTYDITYTIGTGSLLKTVWAKICNEYAKFFVYVGKNEQPSQDEIRQFLVEVLNVYEKTKDYYEPLISAYESVKTTLMNDVVNVNEVMFNDTPQTTNGVLVGDQYATHYTKSTSKSPLATPMARLQEIQDGLKRLYDDWVKEFRRIFIEDNLNLFD